MLSDKIVYPTKKIKEHTVLQVLQNTISFKMENIKIELPIKLFNANYVSLVYENHISTET